MLLQDFVDEEDGLVGNGMDQEEEGDGDEMEEGS